MKKYWPLLLIVVVLTAIIGMSRYADSVKQHCEESKRQAKATAVDGKISNNAEDACKPPVWAEYVTWPEGFGAWAVILTLLAIAWQSSETRTAADAALLNAKAMIHSQRPWLIVRIEEKPTGTAAMTQFQFHIYNHGNSPAYVTSCSQLTVAWLENPNMELPAKPVYKAREWDTCLLLPKHDIPIEGKIDPWAYDVMQSLPGPPKMQLVVYGIINYTDGATEDIHQTAFCYRRKRDKLSDMGGHLVLCGPSAYNKHT